MVMASQYPVFIERWHSSIGGRWLARRPSSAWGLSSGSHVTLLLADWVFFLPLAGSLCGYHRAEESGRTRVSNKIRYD